MVVLGTAAFRRKGKEKQREGQGGTRIYSATPWPVVSHLRLKWWVAGLAGGAEQAGGWGFSAMGQSRLKRACPWCCPGTRVGEQCPLRLVLGTYSLWAVPTKGSAALYPFVGVEAMVQEVFSMKAAQIFRVLGHQRNVCK